jgi:competence protein ComEC
MRDKIFYAVCFGFILGILVRSFVYVNVYAVLFISVIAFALFLIFAVIFKSKWGIVFSVFILVFSFGILRFQFGDIQAPKIFETQVGQKIPLLGKIMDEPTFRENSVALEIETELSKQKTKILMTTSLNSNFKYGDILRIEGVLKKPENFTGDNAKEFDYINYLRKDHIFYLMSYPHISLVSSGNGNKIKSGLFYAKEKFLDKLHFAIPEPESLLMGGLILGERSSFDQSLRQSLVNTGTIHIVALSGYNVTIVAEWFMALFSFLPQIFAIGMGILSVLLFILMTGASSTALRAGIMATLALVARATGRNYDIGRALILAGVLMIFINPLLLVYDVSFQLSFIATIAVIFFSPKIEKHFLWVTLRFGLRYILSVTSAAYIFIFPFILYKMGNFSLVALPANFLILPFIPLTMMLGFITGFIGIIWKILALPVGFISYAFLHYELAVINFLSHLPFASFSIPDFPLILTLIIYAYFIYRLFGKSIKHFFKSIDY